MQLHIYKIRYIQTLLKQTDLGKHYIITFHLSHTSKTETQTHAIQTHSTITYKQTNTFTPNPPGKQEIKKIKIKRNIRAKMEADTWDLKRISGR